MLLTTVLSPVTNYWYYLWCLPLLACCALPTRARRCLAAALAVLGVLAPLDPSLHLPNTLVIIVGSVGAALALAALPPVPRPAPGGPRAGGAAAS
jgi:alpha-1,6-mannosyltransferase